MTDRNLLVGVVLTASGILAAVGINACLSIERGSRICAVRSARFEPRSTRSRANDVFEMRRSDLRDAVSCIVQEGVYPSQRQVFEHAGLARTFRRVPRYIEVWLDALREHGIRPT